MSSPQDGPTRKKQKAAATRKLDAWRLKKAEEAAATAKATKAPAKKK
jgi:hypothetical protein